MVPFELPHGPFGQLKVQHSQEGLQGRFAIGSIVVHPASHDRIDPCRHFLQGHRRPLGKLPRSNRFADGLLCFETDRRIETHEDSPVPAVPASPSPKLIAQKVKARVLRVPASETVFTVDDPRLVGVYL